jgi:hypothetical protein
MRTLQWPDGAPAASAGPLRILHLEDDPSDAELVGSRLRAAGLTCDVVVASTRRAFDGALSLAEVPFAVERLKAGTTDLHHVLNVIDRLLVESRESLVTEVSPS